ncbi:MAG: major capsid protein P2 [Pseudomonadota bacterium]
MPLSAGTNAAMNPIMYRGDDLNDFQNVVAGGTARLEVRNGFMYHEIQVEYAGVTVAQMTEVRVKLNNQVYYRLRGSDLDVIEFYDGGLDSDSVGILVIPFSRKGLKVPGQEVLTALNMQVPDGSGNLFTNLTVEIDIAGDAAAPVLTPIALKQPADLSLGASGAPVGPGYVRRLIDFTQGSVHQGVNRLRDLVIPGQVVASRLLLNRLFLNIDPAHVRNIQVRRDNVEEEYIRPRVNERNQRANGKQPVAGWTIIDPTAQGIGLNGFDFSTRIDELEFNLDLQPIPNGAALPASFRFIADFIGLPTQ